MTILLLVIIVAVAGAAVMFRAIKRERTKLREQSERLAEERSHWDEIYAAHVTQRMHDALFPPGQPYTDSAATRRIEPGDRIFKNWSYLATFNREMSRIIDAHQSVSVDGLDANEARITAEVAALAARYVESGKIWEIPFATVANIEGYYDASGNSTQPMVNGERMNAADGTPLFVKISWDRKDGYMMVAFTQR